MKKIILGVLATALSTASTVAFSPSAKADSIYDHRPQYSREDYRDHRWENRRWEDRHDYSRREYYPQRYYNGRYYPQRDSGLQLVVPLIFR